LGLACEVLARESAAVHGIVIGGGIGGMALAAALRRVGISSDVHEQAPELREVGAGLGLWSNALIALQRLGAFERVSALGSRLKRVEIRKPDGRVIAVTSMVPVEKSSGLPGSICVHRADLLRELVGLCDERRIHLGSRCVAVTTDSNEAKAEFADGSSVRGDFLIGADGLRSVVRAQLFGDSPPRYAGYTCWRGVARLGPDALPSGTAFETWGRGRRFSVHPCGPGRLFWWATHNEPAAGRDGPGGRKADVQALFSNWHEPIPAVIAATPEILRNDIEDRPPVREWGRGCVTLLGDAAHPTTPNLGQGACQALEDAVVLADQLRRGGSIASALRTYEDRRRRQTSRITIESLRFGRIAQWENPVACTLRDGATRLVPSAASLWILRRHFHPDLPGLPLPRIPQTP
jgi:2-polyprenyl-6-methoxyphenol hydroxylase-like FAD-dependent oxidoreductase